MKIIKYCLMTETNIGTEEEPIMHKSFSHVSLPYSESNMAIAEKEAYNGEVHVEEIPDDPATEIADLKAQLDATDYQAIKYAEGWITEEDYAPIKAQRQAIRDQINELEAQLASENTM